MKAKNTFTPKIVHSQSVTHPKTIQSKIFLNLKFFFPDPKFSWTQKSDWFKKKCQTKIFSDTKFFQTQNFFMTKLFFGHQIFVEFFCQTQNFFEICFLPKIIKPLQAEHFRLKSCGIPFPVWTPDNISSLTVVVWLSRPEVIKKNCQNPNSTTTQLNLT